MKDYHAEQAWFEGRLEKEILPILTVDPRTVSIEQDLDPIRWSDGARWLEYRPRFCVRRTDGNAVLIEVAWASDAETYELRKVLGLVQPFARAAGYAAIEFYTDVQIRAPALLYNAHLLRRAASHRPDNSVLEKAAVRARAAGSAVSGQGLMEGLASGPEALLALARLVFDGRLRPSSPHEKIGLDTYFSIRH
jgi:hypothetical protein